MANKNDDNDDITNTNNTANNTNTKNQKQKQKQQKEETTTPSPPAATHTAGIFTAKKTRFDGLDVAAMTAHIRKHLLGHKVVNIYDGTGTSDGNKNTFILKLTNPTSSSSSTENKKTMLLLESGIRFHPTSYDIKSTTSLPSNFCSKLRKHLRSSRLENVTQLGHYDRVVDFRFGAGAKAHHLILELYARGNVILTDGRYEIVALLRTHDYSIGGGGDKRGEAKGDEEEVVKVAVRQVYPVTYATTLQREAEDGGRSGESSSGSCLKNLSECDDVNDVTCWFRHELKQQGEWMKKMEEQQQNEEEDNGKKKKKKKKKKKGDGMLTLKNILLKPSSGVHYYGPSLLEHCIRHAQLDPQLKLPPILDDDNNDDSLSSILSTNQLQSLLSSLTNEGRSVMERLDKGDGEGYILYKPKSPNNNNNTNSDNEAPPTTDHSDKQFEEFQPHHLLQHTTHPTLTLPTFSHAVDQFFSLLEGQKRTARAHHAQILAHQRLEKIRSDQESRTAQLFDDCEEKKRQAHLVERHAECIDNALSVINSALDNGMDWDDLAELIAFEKSNDNPVAMIIDGLELDDEKIRLVLPDDDESGRCVTLSVVVTMGAHANARRLFDEYRASGEKYKKTVEASDVVMAAAEANAKKMVEEAQKGVRGQGQGVVSLRKWHWFEKFNWFITSDNYLVIAGKDAQQNEVLVKRYLRPGDAYLHADVHGAASCILRAKRQRTPSGTTTLPLSTQALTEAGQFTICRSSAWTSRMITSAWWVESHQVSKTAPTGEYLTVGSFMIRGKKNYLSASALEMGLGVLFRLEEGSVGRHKGERRDFALLSLEQEEEDGDVVEEVKVVKAGKKKGVPAVKQQSHGDANDDDDLTPKKGDGENRVDSKSPKKDKSPPTNDNDNKSAATPPQDNGTPPTTSTATATAATTTPTPTPTEEEDKSTLPVKTNDDASETKSGKKKKKGLSARDRRLIKKYGSLEAAEAALAAISTTQQNKDNDDDDNNDDDNNNNTKPKETKPLPRGKKSKLKKRAKKYADQDDDDRDLAMRALHGGTTTLTTSDTEDTPTNTNDNDTTSSTQRRAAMDATALLVKDPEKIAKGALSDRVVDTLASCVTTKNTVRWDKFDADIIELLIDLNDDEAQFAAVTRLKKLTTSTRVDNFAASLAGIVRAIKRFGHEDMMKETAVDGGGGGGRRKKQKDDKDSDDDDDNDDDDAIDDSPELSKLTGRPVAEDVILYAIPVCAPYHSLKGYDYRVKLTPGSQKRGKASKQCLDIFLKSNGKDETSTADASSPEKRFKNYIKLITDNEWTQVICGDVKIAAPGASQLGKKGKGKGGGGKGKGGGGGGKSKGKKSKG